MTVAAIAGGIGSAASIGLGVANAMGQSGATRRSKKEAAMAAALAQQKLQWGLDQAIPLLDPYNKAGLRALSKLEAMPGVYKPYSLADYQADPGYTPFAFDQASLEATPGYQFQLNQGLKAVTNSATARGSVLSGQTLKGINDYAQGQANTTFDQAWNRAQNAYQRAFDRNQARAGTLFGMSRAGQEAAGTQAGLYTGTARDMAGIISGEGMNQANLTMQGARNQSQAMSGINNAIQGGLANFATAFLTQPTTDDTLTSDLVSRERLW